MFCAQNSLFTCAWCQSHCDCFLAHCMAHFYFGLEISKEMSFFFNLTWVQKAWKFLCDKKDNGQFERCKKSRSDIKHMILCTCLFLFIFWDENEEKEVGKKLTFICFVVYASRTKRNCWKWRSVHCLLSVWFLVTRSIFFFFTLFFFSYLRFFLHLKSIKNQFLPNYYLFVIRIMAFGMLCFLSTIMNPHVHAIVLLAVDLERRATEATNRIAISERNPFNTN